MVVGGSALNFLMPKNHWAQLKTALCLSIANFTPALLSKTTVSCWDGPF